MRVLLDTSVLVAAMIEAHPVHLGALPWLQRVKSGADIGFVASHFIAELYAVLTVLPLQPRIAPDIAWRLIRRNVFESCEVVSLSVEDYAATNAGVDRVITLNEKDFQRVYPELAGKISPP